MLPGDEWERAIEAARTAEVFISIGTSASVYPAAGLVQVAHQSGARVVIVNPDPTPADELAEWILGGPAGEILPRLV
jgi:NAD-dependent deacetylase